MASFRDEALTSTSSVSPPIAPRSCVGVRPWSAPKPPVLSRPTCP